MGSPSGGSALDRIAPQPGTLTLGVEFPLDNDWSPAGRRRARAEGRPNGVPGLTHHHRLAQSADRLGFAALWLRDVPCGIRPPGTRGRSSTPSWGTSRRRPGEPDRQGRHAHPPMPPLPGCAGREEHYGRRVNAGEPVR